MEYEITFTIYDNIISINYNLLIKYIKKKKLNYREFKKI